MIDLFGHVGVLGKVLKGRIKPRIYADFNLCWTMTVHVVLLLAA